MADERKYLLDVLKRQIETIDKCISESTFNVSDQEEARAFASLNERLTKSIETYAGIAGIY